MALNDKIHAMKITSDFKAMGKRIFTSTPMALLMPGNTKINDNKVYIIKTSSTLFFSSDFFFTISLPPFKRP